MLEGRTALRRPWSPPVPPILGEATVESIAINAGLWRMQAGIHFRSSIGLTGGLVCTDAFNIHGFTGPPPWAQRIDRGFNGPIRDRIGP